MTAMASWELFEDIRDAQDELLRMNRMPAQRINLFGHQHQPSMSTPPWTPAVDISERKDAYMVAAELPGVGIDDLEITFGAIADDPRPAARRARLRRGADTSVRTKLRRLPPLNHPAHPREAGGYRSLDPGRRAADHGAQGGGSTRQAHPGTRRSG